MFQNDLITARKRSLGQGNIFSSVCQEFCPQEGGIPACPPDQTPPGAGIPPDQAPPPLGPDPPGAGTPQDQAPPPLRSACWEIRSTSGRYASY